MRFLLSFVISFITLSMSAQHISFMGIPLGTHINTFRQSILPKRFKATSAAAPNTYCFEGGFSGYNVTLNVLVTPKTKKVYKVYGVFTDVIHCKSGNDYRCTTSMDGVNNAFKDLCQKLTRKYGSYYPFNPNDAQYYKWYNWDAKGGNIDLSIVCFNDQPDYVKLIICYNDKATQRLNDQEEYDDI